MYTVNMRQRLARTLRYTEIILPTRAYNVALVTQTCRNFYTNVEKSVTRYDPYAQLGLQYGEAATTTEIKQAFKKKAAILHPDVNKDDPPSVAQRKFQDLVKAYNVLLKANSSYYNFSSNNDSDDDFTPEDAWRFAVWRQSDQIAIDRTDVAGQARKRPQPSPAGTNNKYKVAQLGKHPNHQRSRGEYLTDASGTTVAATSTVGTGQNKWVTKKDYKPWKKEE